MIEKVLNMISRPLSPHLQIYKLPLAAIISISHRMIGAVLFASGVVLALLCFAWVAHINMEWLAVIVFSLFGKASVSWLVVVVVFYAMAEIRYIAWGLNYGMAPTFIRTSNIVIVAATLIISTVSWVKMWCGL